MLTRLRLQNYRLLRDVTLDFEPGKPIVLIGPNASGKSSVLEALELLRSWSESSADDVYPRFGRFVTRLGPLMSATRSETSTFEIEFRSTPGAPTMSYLLEANSELSAAIEHERLRTGRLGHAVLERRYQDAVLRSPTGAEVPEEVRSLDLGRLACQLLRQPKQYPDLRTLELELRALHVYGGFATTPRRMRDPREGTSFPWTSTPLVRVERIDPRGFNLINALHTLDSAQPDVWRELLRAFTAEFPFIELLKFPADPSGGAVGLNYYDRRFPNRALPAESASRGMITFLCLLAAILTPAPASVLAFDEPENHLHPSALKRLVELLEDASERTAVIVATHSDRLLDHLSDPAASVRICEPTPDGVTIRALDHDALEEWRTEYRVSELRERGHLDPANGAAGDA